MAIPDYTCSMSDPVFEDIQILDSNGAQVTIIVATECTADWFVAAAAEFSMWGPNYPLSWRHAPPPPEPEDEGE